MIDPSKLNYYFCCGLSVLWQFCCYSKSRIALQAMIWANLQGLRRELTY